MKKLILLLLFIPLVSCLQPAEEYFNSGYDKAEAYDDYGAISDYTKAIELDPNYAKAYTNRGASKQKAKDYNGAISDFNKAIELDPNDAKTYYNRAISKYYTNDLKGACEDARKSGSLGNPFLKMIEAACN